MKLKLLTIIHPLLLSISSCDNGDFTFDEFGSNVDGPAESGVSDAKHDLDSAYDSSNDILNDDNFDSGLDEEQSIVDSGLDEKQSIDVILDPVQEELSICGTIFNCCSKTCNLTLNHLRACYNKPEPNCILMTEGGHLWCCPN